MKEIFDNQKFIKHDFKGQYSNEYDGCQFVQCDFSNVSFDGAEFIDCTFDNCNVSMAKFDRVTLSRVAFKNSKVAGVDFSKCSKSLFSLSFENCILNYALFLKNELKNTVFKDCILHEVTFIETNLLSSKFINCDLAGTLFDRANLEKADFTTSRNYSINPSINKMKKARFAMPAVLGLLGHLDIIIEEN